MGFIIPELFTREWLKRAEEDRPLDVGDRFICLWVAFNSWLHGKFGETEKDYELINKVSNLQEFNKTFENQKNTNLVFKEYLTKLEKLEIEDMRFFTRSENDRSYKKYNGDFDSYIRVIYQIRCNLFHGRKDSNLKLDMDIIEVAYNSLLIVFKKYLQEHDNEYLM